jgi:hypothetical protein
MNPRQSHIFLLASLSSGGVLTCQKWPEDGADGNTPSEMVSVARCE